MLLLPPRPLSSSVRSTLSISSTWSQIVLSACSTTDSHRYNDSILQGISQVTARPAGLVRRQSNSRGSSWVGSGRVRRWLEIHGSSRVGSEGFQKSRLGSDHPGPTQPEPREVTRPLKSPDFLTSKPFTPRTDHDLL